jgi:hypothetical protein
MVAKSQNNWDLSLVHDNFPSYPFQSLAYDQNGVPHLACYYKVTQSIYHVWRSGDTWIGEFVDHSSGTYTTSIAFDHDGNPRISYGDGRYFGNLMFARKGGGAWTTTVVSRGTWGDAGEFSKLTFDGHGIPHIVYNDGRLFGDLYYATMNLSSGKWECTKVDNGGSIWGDTGYSPDLKFDAANHPHVVYIGSEPWGLWYATTPDGTNWTLTRLDDVEKANFYNRTYTGVVALDSRGYPHVSYYNSTISTNNTRYLLYYISWNGMAWNRENVADLSTVSVPYHDPLRGKSNYIFRDIWTSIAIDGRDVLHISYCDVTDRSLKYATRSPSGTRDLQTVEVVDDIPMMSCLAYNPAGKPGIAYYNRINGQLRFMQGSG